MILAGDIGGTNARLALFEHDDLRNPTRIEVYASRDFASFETIVERFLAAEPTKVDAACFGIAGPVRDGRSDATNLEWDIDSARVAALLGLETVGLLNDLEATAIGLDALESADVVVLNEGTPDPAGNVAVIAAGTGLGEAGIVRARGGAVPLATESGHAGFAPSTSEQTQLLEYLRDTRGGPVSVEHVCSGTGIVNIFRWCLHEAGRGEPDWFAGALAEGDAAAAIAQAADDGSDEDAVRTIRVFVEIYGSEASNAAFRMLATGGVYVAGGIAGKLLAALSDGRFMTAFLDKSRLVDLLRDIPVRVVANDRTALLGAVLDAARRWKAAPTPGKLDG